MAAPVTFSGLVSGLDSSSIVTSLVNAAKAADSTWKTSQTNLNSQNSVVESISNDVSALGTLASTMTLASDVSLRTGTSSDSHVSVAVSNSAVATTHDLRVQQLAQSQVVSSTTFASNTAGIAGTGGMTITTGGGTPVPVSWGPTDDLNSIASKINSTGAGVNASVLYDGSTYRLIVTNTQTGKANASTFTDSGNGLGLSDPSNIKIPAQNAIVDVDGVPVTRPTNVIDDAIPGVTITAVSPQATTDPDTSVAVGVDTTGIATQLQSFVTAFNAVANDVNKQLTYTGTAPAPGTLYGDSTVRELQSSLAAMMTASYGTTTPSDLGLTIDDTGVLSLDTTKLDSALQSNPNAVSDLFATSKGGFAKAVSNMSNVFTDPENGVLTTKSQAITSQVTLLQNEIDQNDANATALQTRLQNEFNALESTLSSIKNEGNYLTDLFSGSSTSSSSSATTNTSSSA
jgi:flagellar hook-associated protein 2